MPTKQEAAAQTREKLIASALQTIQQHGIVGLTLDAVAREAGVSKGGLLHHFANKDALVEAILRSLLDAFTQQVHARYAAEPIRKGRWLRAYIHATFDDEKALPMEVIALLSNALVENTTLLALVRSDVANWNTLLASDGISATRAIALRMAADAYWTERLIQSVPLDSKLCTALRNELLAMVKEGEAGA